MTRVGALIQIPVLTGALGLVHSKEALFSTNQNIELTALVLFILIIYAIIGSGNISFDHHILDDDDKPAWIETFIQRLFAKEGRLAFVRLSSKIQKNQGLPTGLR